MTRRAPLGPTPEWILQRQRDRAVILMVGIMAVLVGGLLVLGVAVTL